MSDKLMIGVDIGGTKIAFAVVDPSGNIIDETVIPTHSTNAYEVTVDRIAQQLNLYLNQFNNIIGIGIGIPGPINSEQGIVLNAVNLGWQDKPIQRDIQARLNSDCLIYIENDVNVGAIGEYIYGVAQGCRNTVYLAIGTGLGGAVLLDNKLIRGVSDSEMEIGHISLDPINGRSCSCGQRGCVEMSISGKGLLSNVQEQHPNFPDTTLSLDNLTTYDILTATKINDALAQFVIDEAATALGITCAWCIMIFNPEQIVLGGGMIRAFYKYIEAKMLDTIKARCLSQSFNAVSIELSQLENAALGASALVHYHQIQRQLTL